MTCKSKLSRSLQTAILAWVFWLIGFISLLYGNPFLPRNDIWTGIVIIGCGTGSVLFIFGTINGFIEVVYWRDLYKRALIGFILNSLGLIITIMCILVIRAVAIVP